MNDNQDQIAYTPEEEESFNLIDTAANQQAQFSGVKTQSARIAQLETALARLATQVSINGHHEVVTRIEDVEWILPILEDK